MFVLPSLPEFNAGVTLTHFILHIRIRISFMAVTNPIHRNHLTVQKFKLLKLLGSQGKCFEYVNYLICNYLRYVFYSSLFEHFEKCLVFCPESKQHLAGRLQRSNH